MKGLDVYTMSTSELCERLGLTKNTFNTVVKRGTLEKRLEENGLKLLNSYKLGREKYYELEKSKLTPFEELQAKQKIKEKEKHAKYCHTRMKELETPRKKVIEDSGTKISMETGKRWDDGLVEEKVIKQECVKYMYYDRKKELAYEIDELTYRRWWYTNGRFAEQLKKLKVRKYKNKIDDETYDFEHSRLIDAYKPDGFVTKYTTYSALESMKQMFEELNTKVELSEDTLREIEENKNNITSQNKEVK